MTSIKEKVLNHLAADFADIERELAANLTPYLDVVRDAAGHILYAGGKRLRPLLMVLCARLCGSDQPRNKRFSIIFEYIHAATLLHDDLVDGAELRRGKPAGHRLFGNEIAVLTGDFLLARSLSIATETGLMDVIRIIGRITEEMSQGEIRQLQNKGRPDLSEEEYMDVIRRKTAVLIEGACEIGALVAGADASKTAALGRFGCSLGMAFQMVDDLLDYTSSTAALGKAVGADLKEGKLTLPVIFSLKQAPPEARNRMLSLIRSKAFTDTDFSTFVGFLHRYGGIDHTRREAARCVDEAKSALNIFPPTQDKEILELLADYALDRKE